MFVMFLAGVLLCWWAEARGNPIHQQLGVAVADGNMEGKEVRFGIFNSALFATVTTDASCGAVNSMHDSFTPLGGLVPLFNIQTRRSHFRRRRRGTLRHVGFRRAGRVHRRADGRAHAGISRQKNRSLRRENGAARVRRSWRSSSSASRPGRAVSNWGTGRTEQQRPARLQRNSLCLYFRRGQQRQRLRRPQREHAVV